MAIIKVGNKATAPSAKPDLLFDFVNSKTLDPRIGFTRSTTGTYYDGKTKTKTDENRIKYSEEFNQGDWQTSSLTVSINSTTAPNGETTADQISASTGNYIGQVYDDWVSGDVWTFSVYAKYVSNYIQLSGGTSAFGANTYANFDLNSGTVTSTGSNVTSTSIDSFGNGWYRISMTFPVVTSTSSSGVYISVASTGTQGPRQNGASSASYVWGAQLERSSNVSYYVKTTNYWVENYTSKLMTASSNTPRFDHDPVDNESLGLLLEETRTNLVANSSAKMDSYIQNMNQYDNYGWAPDGTHTATLAVPTSTLGTHRIIENGSSGAFTSGDIYTMSIYVKYTKGTRYILVTDNADAAQESATIDLQTGTLYNEGSSNINTKLENVGGGWLRVSFAYEKTDPNNNMAVTIYAYEDANFSSWAGDDYRGFLYWGIQAEKGDFVSSYIPTSGSSVTRAYDFTSMIDNYDFRQDQGTIYSEFNLNGVARTGGGANERRHIASLTSNGGITDGWFTQYADSTSVDTLAYTLSNNNYNTISNTDYGEHKYASSFISETYGMQTHACLNGGTVSSLTGINWPKSQPFDRLELGQSSGNTLRVLGGHLRKVAYYPNRLSNDELRGLTEV